MRGNMRSTRSSLLAAALLMGIGSVGAAQTTGTVDKAVHQIAPVRQRRKSQRFAGGTLTQAGLLATRAGRPGTVAQDKRRSMKARNRAANRAAHR